MSEFIKFNERAYKFIKGSAINSILDALVELITNCDDAYDKGNIKDKYIDIELDYNGILSVTDQAIGLNSIEIENCFLQIGNYTSSENNRGFFSRGAKDICALGNIHFESIKNNLYSKLILDKNAKGKILIKDKNVYDENILLNIKNNGLKVTIFLIDSIKILDPTDIIDLYPRQFNIRNILNNKNCICKIKFKNSENELGMNNKFYDFKYNFPKGNVILYLSYYLESYDCEVFFTISKSDNKLYDHKNIKYCDWGILITSGKVIHDITCLNNQFKYDNNMKTLFGIIHCDYINKLLLDYDKNGASKLNPFPILDPSRIGGLKYEHPFMKELIKIPLDRLTFILQELETEDEKEYTFCNKEITDIINTLNTTGEKFIESNNLMHFIENKNSQLIRGIESDRGKFINIEKNFIKNLNKSKRVFLNGNNKKVEYLDPMSELFKIIGEGGNGNKPTNELDIAKLFKEYDNSLSSNINQEFEEKKFFVFNKVEASNFDGSIKKEFESQNFQYLKKDNIFMIKFINSTQDRKYEIYQSGQKIILKININFPILKNFFGSNIKSNETTKLEAIHLLKQILTEALTRIQLIGYINKDFIKINNNDSQENFYELFKNYDHYKNNIDISIEKIVKNIINNERNKIKGLITGTINFNEEENNDIEIENNFLNSSDINDIGFKESEISNEITNDEINLLKEEKDILYFENIKLKKELNELKEKNLSLNEDLDDLKEILKEEPDKIAKKFNKVQKFINFKFKSPQLLEDYININEISHLYISIPLKNNDINFEKYNLKIYDDKYINENILFYGLYRDYDYEVFDKIEGKKFIIWHGNDANINYSNRKNNLIKFSNKAEINFCDTIEVEKYFQIMDLEYVKIII